MACFWECSANSSHQIRDIDTLDLGMTLDFNPSVAADSWSLPPPDLIASLVATGSPIDTTFDPNEYAISDTPPPPFYVISTGKQNKKRLKIDFVLMVLTSMPSDIS